MAQHNLTWHYEYSYAFIKLFCS